MAVHKNNVHVIWSDDTTGNGDIYFKARLDNGTEFGGRKFLAKNNGSSFEPQIAVSPNDIIHAAWQDDTPYDRQQGNDDVLFRLECSPFDYPSSFNYYKVIIKIASAYYALDY